MGRPRQRPRIRINTAQKALVIAKQNRRSIKDQELKFADNGITTTALSVAGVIIQLTNLATGDTAITREGNKVVIRKIEISGNLSAASDAFCRIMLIKDTQTNGAIYTSADIIQDNTAHDNIVSQANRVNMKRFKILRDWKIRLVHNTSQESAQFKLNRKVRIPINYGSDNGDITDVNSNGLSLLQMTNVVADFPTITTSIRLRFADS